MRVYELAKELNMKSIDLVDRARKTWKLPIRSYMEVLTDDIEKKIRKKITEERKSAESKKQTAKKSSSKIIRIKKKTAEASSAKPSAVQVSKKAIIRRKAEEITELSLKKQKPPDQKIQEEPPLTEEKASPLKPSSLKEDLNFLSSHLEESLKEEEKRKTRKNLEQTAQKFRASDFRKREVVFQPKKKRNLQDRLSKKTQITTPKSHKRVVKFYENLSVQDLSRQLGVKLGKLLDKLKSEGLDSQPETLLDFDMVSLIAGEFGFETKNCQKTFEQLAQELKFGQLNAEPTACPPVVTVMGHVDHGKTTLLDQFRKTTMADQEEGGITQHIGAYSVPVKNSFITFIDTPGHEAFSAMRARGARLTNIVVIVVSAVDGVQSQTVEAIEHARSAKTPILVAVNKIDKPGADIEKIKKQMSEHNLLSEDWGGDTIFVSVSAKTGDGIQDLLERILLVAEMQELKANPKQSAEGVIIESRMVKGRGWTASLIVQNGTLKKSQYIMTSSLLGRVRQMTNDQGKIVSSAEPGRAIEISGFDSAPKVGDLFYAIKNDKPAREFLSKQKMAVETPVSLEKKSMEELLKVYTQKTKELALVVKADVAGSLEAVKNSLSKIGSDEVQLNIIHSGLGGITESDVLLALTAEGAVVGFNVRPDSKALQTAKDQNVPLLMSTIIYELLSIVKKQAIGILDPNILDEVCGKAEIREVFSFSSGAVAGSYILSGTVNRRHLVRLIRDGRVIHEGKIKSLRRFKDDVKEVSEKYECGIGLEQYNDLKPGDTIETYLKKEVARTEF